VKEEELMKLMRFTAGVSARYALMLHHGLSPNLIDSVTKQQTNDLAERDPEIGAQAKKLLELILEQANEAVLDIGSKLPL
jgi:hypothetical protein